MQRCRRWSFEKLQRQPFSAALANVYFLSLACAKLFGRATASVKILTIRIIRGKVYLPMPLHPLLARELRQSKRLQKFFDSLSESARQHIDHSVREVKKEDTRLRRAQHAAEYLMEAMEAELDPPPLMKAAFRRNAQARQGWKLMPQPLRRQYLIFIFRGRYPETRALYIERTVLDAALYADRHTGNTTNPDVET
jgi:hypothetical protein